MAVGKALDQKRVDEIATSMLDKGQTELADNAQWVADNYDKTVHPRKYNYYNFSK
jgi:hypothetical protein